MTKTIELLERFKKAQGGINDSEASRRLKINRQTVANWRAGVRHAEPDSIEKMCTMTGEKVAQWVPWIEAERARNAESRKVWLRLAAQAAMITLLALPYAAHAAQQLAESTAHQMYIM